MRLCGRRRLGVHVRSEMRLLSIGQPILATERSEFKARVVALVRQPGDTFGRVVPEMDLTETAGSAGVPLRSTASP